MATGMELDETVRSAILSNADVRRALQLTIEDGQRFPDRRSVRQWALLRHAHRIEALKVARSQRRRRSYFELTRQFATIVSPVSGTAAMDRYWALLMADRPDEAKRVLEAAAQKDVPLPQLP